MEKRKRWQLAVILAVILITLFNILPTIFYYSKPLKKTVGEGEAKEVAYNIIDRVNAMEDDAVEWIYSFTKHLRIKPLSVKVNENDPRLITVDFKNDADAELFRKLLPRAGSLIAFVPAQLEVSPYTDSTNSVLVERRVGLKLSKDDADKLFKYSTKFDDEGNIAPDFKEYVYDRTSGIIKFIAGTSEAARKIEMMTTLPATDPNVIGIALNVSKDIVDVNDVYGLDNALAKRFFGSFTQSDSKDRSGLIQQFVSRLETSKKALEIRITNLEKEIETGKEAEGFIDSSKEETLASLRKQVEVLEKAGTIVRQNSALFNAGKAPLTQEGIYALLADSEKTIDLTSYAQTISIAAYHPTIESITLDWSDGFLTFNLYDDLTDLNPKEGETSEEAFVREKAESFVINEIAKLSRATDEEIKPGVNNFTLSLENLNNSKSFLTFNLGEIAEKEVQQVKKQIQGQWLPTHKDLVRDNFPIWDFEAFQNLSSQDQKLGLFVYAPSNYEEAPPEGFRLNSVYVVARGLGTIIEKYQQFPDSEDAKGFQSDLQALGKILERSGFIAYPGSTYGFAADFKNDYIFELSNYYSNILNATRENFFVHGSKRKAILEFTDVEQRILADNKIDDRIHEDLLKWKEEHQSAQVSLDVIKKMSVPAPTKNVYWENAKLTAKKYFRGDDRKILRWGLDLSGGKSVRIGLRDQNDKVVTDPADLKQAVNELYTRINKMGVSERSIRIENNNIILDFPGSQGVSANELVQASAMFFHIVNEKFSTYNPALGDTVNNFLQEVWNEAVVTNRKDIASINEIAWKHLGGTEGDQPSRPRNEYARILAENGLTLQAPGETSKTSAFNDTISLIARLRGEDFADWQGQTHPLMVVFANYALEGSSLQNINVGYDPSQGNILMFGVARSYTGKDRTGSPRDDFYSWTSQFSEEKVLGTPKETYSRGLGWRMAVVLNDQVISSPNLKAALRDGGMISGKFTQREISQLAADLKAGSLSFKPQILSEHNISPDLGKEERSKGIYAALIGLVLVCAIMISYYRFAGVVACCAVVFNLLIMWGVLQNLDAALSLPGIAAIVLTVGMAVDANVLVFERTREEFKQSGRIASAIATGYRKAFSAIVDSNLTTILAALILIQFDSGPIKGFALTLIIGIASSMFTSLFMTRYFFAGWVQNPNNKELKMAELVANTKYDFLKYAKPAFIISGILIVVGSFFLVQQKNTILGMDFTGGYAMIADFEEQGDVNYRLKAQEALANAGAPDNDFQVQQLSRENQLRIQFGIGMEEEGRPFYGMPPEITDGAFEYTYQKDPRISWVVNALSEGGLTIQQTQLETIENNWTSMSGQFSDAMRNNALIALGCALIGILIYITFRFEFKYAIAAVIGTAHDVFLTLGVLALLHLFGLPVQIDLQVVGAMMTIIGYSLNDTIIVFDRVREDAHLYKRLSFAEVINQSINVTLARTLLTSITTLVVLFALVILGGSAIFTFSLVMTIGVLLGTLGSLFIAAPLLLFFHQREEQKESAAAHA